jgi:hypothetical protein
MKNQHRLWIIGMALLFAPHSLAGLEYVDLGVIPVGLPDSSCVLKLPYYKPEGIIQIPSWPYRSLAIHKIMVDGVQLFSTRNWYASNEAADRIYVDTTGSEAECRTLEVLWHWAIHEYTNQVIQRGLFYTTVAGDIPSAPEVYNIPYGAKKISMVYSIRFFIYDSGYKLLDTIESEEYGVTWEMEWHLPEG